MIINGDIDIKIFGASVSSKIIHPTNIEIEKENNKKISSKKYYKKIELKILFQGKNRDEIYLNISNFMKYFIDEVRVKFKNLKNEYICFIKDSNVEEPEINEWLYLHLQLDSIELGEEKVEMINRTLSKEINILGNIETPAIIEITPSIGVVDLKINGLGDDPITIKNLEINKKIIINGDEGTVLQEGINKFNDIDMWEFPILYPGRRNITLSKNNCDVTIKYNPRYI